MRLNIKDNHKWWILAAMTGSLSMIMIDQTIVTVTLPTIQREFRVSGNSLDWIINSYILGLAVTVAVGGRLGDIFGRVKTFIFGTLLFAAASVCCGLAGSIGVLLGARVVQGFAAAFMQPASAAIVNTTFELNERGKAMAIYAGVAMSFMALGPLLGGFFTEYITWRWAFYINVPIAVFTILLTLFVRPNDEIIKGQKIDIPGVVLLITSISAIVLGIQQSNEWGWVSIPTLSILIGGILVFCVFIVVEHKVEEPILNLNLLKNKSFCVDAIILFCIQFALIGQTVFMTIFMQNVLGFGALNAGAWMLVTVVMVALVSQISGRVFDRIGLRLPVVTGMLLITISYYYQAFMLSAQNICLLIPGMLLMGIGIGCVMTPANTDALNQIGRKLRGQASGLVQTARQIGGTIGIAVLFALANTVLYAKNNSIAAETGKSKDHVDLLFGILSRSLEYQKAVAMQFSDNWQEIIIKVKLAVSQSIASTFILAGTLALAGLIIAIVFLRPGRLTEEKDV